MAKPMKTLELHYPTIQFLIRSDYNQLAPRTRWLFYHFISNSGLWNNCYILKTMISPEVGICFPSRYHCINWPADCLLGFLTTFYSLTLQYFFMNWFDWPWEPHWEEGKARFPPPSSCLVCVCPWKITARQVSGKPCLWPCFWHNLLRFFA